MPTALRNALSVVVGWIVGSIVNMGLITVGQSVVPIEGVDPNDMEALAAVMPTLSAEYFLFPWLAHAVGTLVGAYAAARLAASRKLLMALLVGALFLLGGIAVNLMLPGPTWFAAVDLLFAYLPMAYLGGRLAVRQASS